MRIKFTNDMAKLPLGANGKSAMLENLWSVRLEDMPADFLEFDTRTREGNHYEFTRKGLYIVLVFQYISTHAPFMTLRPYTSEKFDYYKRNLGQIFSIEIAQEDKSEQSKLPETP